MSVSFSQAVNAYQNRARQMEGMATGLEDEAAKGQKPSFLDMVSEAAEAVVNSQNQAEQLKMQSVSGKVDLSDLVTAVANAELALTTVVALRDRVITAYQDIIRMPI